LAVSLLPPERSVIRLAIGSTEKSSQYLYLVRSVFLSLSLVSKVLHGLGNICTEAKNFCIFNELDFIR
jgi:hypothetical protein